MSYAFWNNKGGTGKTSLIFQAICEYAAQRPDQKVLAVDMCPQANLSEVFLGGLVGKGEDHLRRCIGKGQSVGAYFQSRIISPYVYQPTKPTEFTVRPCESNRSIPDNVLLIPGDPSLELQSEVMNSLANTQAPIANTTSWGAVTNWLRDLFEALSGEHNAVFVDCNPSFSIYTKTAVASVDKLILPVMADDSSRRGVSNVISLIYGLSLPSDTYKKFAFNEQSKAAKRDVPKIHLIAKNRITQYMGSVSAYTAVLAAIDKDINTLIKAHPECFTFEGKIGTPDDAFKDSGDPKEGSGSIRIRDFGSTGVVAFASGKPFEKLKSGQHKIGERRIQISSSNVEKCQKDIQGLVKKLLGHQ